MVPVQYSSLFSFIWKFVKLQRWKYLLILLFSIIWSLDATLWPYLIGHVVDIFSRYDSARDAAWPALKIYIVSGIGLWILVEVGFRSMNFLRARANPQLEADIRMAMFDHIQRHSPKYFNEHFAGSLSNKISDMTTQVILILQNMTLFIPAFVTCFLSILFFTQINGVFATILACWIAVHFGVCFFFSPKCVAYSNIHGQARSSLAGKIVDSLTNHFAVNLFSRFSFEKARIEVYQKEEQEKNTRSLRYVSYMFLVVSILFFIGGMILNGTMIVFWLDGKISTGEIIQIFNTTWNVVFIMWFSGETIPQFFQSYGIATQALALMNDPQDVVDLPGCKPLVVDRGEIVFENLSFQYGEKKLFENKHVHIRGGEKVGLVGYSGAGKSTFVNLILRFYPVQQGKILIDGQDIAAVSLESLHRQVSLIPQDPALFHRSLEENIRYGRIEAAFEEVLEAAQLAHCDEFIRKCPDGYNSLVGERGAKLSGGERQRIAIARAMLAKAPILLLDEATSALDSVTEMYIQESLERLMQNRTTIVIAHRLSTLSKMDRILVFDQGKIVEEGTHIALIAKGGHYAHMWKMQAGGFLPEGPIDGA